MRLSRWMVLAAVIAIVIGPARPAAAVLDACADADGDDALTVTDGVQALRAAVGLPSPCTLERCDVDGNGAVTVTDGVGVLARAADLHFYQFYRCPIPSHLQDFSGFGSFSFGRVPALGFCPPLGSVLGAHVDRQPNGTHVARLTVAEERPLGDPMCVQFGAPTDPCIAEIRKPDRVLTAAEVARVRESFAAIETYEVRPPECAIVVYDPCRIDALAWDGSSYDDYPCSSSRVGYGVVDAVTAILDGLIVADEPTGP